jgi:very-short-patch-repair endonuclease
MSKSGELLVAIINNQLDFSIARDKHWYRIPVESVKKLLKEKWPPQWLAFYHTSAFKESAHSIGYSTQVLKISEARRWQLFPELPLNEKSDKLYYQLLLSPLKKLTNPIYSRHWRRIVFIPTTFEKFNNALEINDLYDGSPLEDKLWAALKILNIPAERQEFIRANNKNYSLDFAVYCEKGKLNIETDGDRWHHSPQIAPQDNLRNNNLVTYGWQILRFTSQQICSQMAEYCIPQIVDNINNLGGVEMEKDRYRKIDLLLPGTSFQHEMFK